MFKKKTVNENVFVLLNLLLIPLNMCFTDITENITVVPHHE